MLYSHTQKAPIHLIIVGIGIGMLVGACLAPQSVVRIVLFCSGGLCFLLALCFRQLTVSDEGDELFVCFGPLPLFRLHIQYSDIETVKRTRSSLLEGWGIHLSPNGGVTWNLWGFDCVDVYRKAGRKVRIGTDDPLGLESFLKQRVSQALLITRND